MASDCDVCRAEGFAARARVKVVLGSRSLIATLNVVRPGMLARDEASLSEFAWRMLQAEEGSRIHVSHPGPMTSESRLRAKVYGERLSRADMDLIISDVVQACTPMCILWRSSQRVRATGWTRRRPSHLRTR
jgi:thymidine phosphorylase